MQGSRFILVNKIIYQSCYTILVNKSFFVTNSHLLRKMVNLTNNIKFVKNLDYFFKITFKMIGTHHLTLFI